MAKKIKRGKQKEARVNRKVVIIPYFYIVALVIFVYGLLIQKMGLVILGILIAVVFLIIQLVTRAVRKRR